MPADSRDKLQKLLKQMDQCVEDSLTDLDRRVNHEKAGTPGGGAAAHVQAKMKALQQRQHLYEGLQAQGEASGVAHFSLPAPESRVMQRGQGGGTEVCYHLRCATVELGRQSRSYATSAWRAWALKQQGTRNPGGRRLIRWVDEPLWEERERRVRSRSEVIKQRKQLVGHPIGTMQRRWEQGS